MFFVKKFVKKRSEKRCSDIIRDNYRINQFNILLMSVLFISIFLFTLIIPYVHADIKLSNNVSISDNTSTADNILVINNFDPNNITEDNLELTYVIETDKSFYSISDIVHITINSFDDYGEIVDSDISGLDLFIDTNKREFISYKYLGLFEKSISFSPSAAGEYFVKIFSKEILLDEKSFLVQDISDDQCQKIPNNMLFFIDLKKYDELKSNQENFVLPKTLALLYDDSFGIKKFEYSDVSNSSIGWLPNLIGRYMLYADGVYIDCFFVEDDLVSATDSSDTLSSDNLTGGNLAFISSNKLSVVDSKNLRRNVAIKFFYSDISRISNISDTLDISIFNINNSDINNSINNNLSSNDLIKQSSNNFINNNASFNISNNKEYFIEQSNPVGQELPLSDVIENNTYDVEINFNDSSVKKLRFRNLKYFDAIQLGVDELDAKNNPLPDRIPVKAYAINLYDLEFNSSSFTSVATATELWKCKDWNFTTQECFGTWEFVMNLTPGEEYSVNLYPGDPGFVEAFDTNLTVDVDLVAINNDTVVMSWVSAATGFPLKFKIMLANGSIIVNDTTVDATGDATSRVSLAAIDQNKFIIGLFDGPSQAQFFYIYNRTGGLVQGRTSADTTVGTQSDTDVCQLGDRFAFVYANDDAADQDADFKIYNNSGVQITGETAVDTTMTPEASNQNLVTCSAFNSTTWAYIWYDAGASDDVLISARTNTGTAITSATIDAAVGNAAQVASTGLRNRRIAVVFYDAADRDITITILQLNGAAFTTTLAATDIDADSGNESRVAVQEIDMISQSYFVVAWHDRNDSTIKAAIYNETGIQVIAPFNVTRTPSASNKILDLAGYSSNINLGLCNGTWAIAYSNSSGNAVWETYFYNGSRWNGVCPDIISPDVNLTYPENGSIIEFLSYTLNYTVTDNIDTIIKNCSLYTNVSGSFVINQTSYNVPVGNNYFNISNFPDSKYIWNVICYDNSSNSAFAPLNYSIMQNYYSPNISYAAINATIINQSEVIKLNASITDNLGINYSYITLIYPNSTVINISLKINGNEHYYLFNDTIQTGEYSIVYVWANDSLGKNSSQILSLNFNVTTSDPGIFALSDPLNGTISFNLNPNLTWQQASDTNFANYTIILDKDINFGSPDYIYYTFGLENTSYVVNDTLDVNSIYYWKVIAYDIFGNSRNSTDIASYITEETRLMVDVDFVAINNDTVVISWISAAGGFPLKFKILKTNGSVVVNDTVVDATGDATSRVALTAIDSSRFVIASFDGPAQANYFYIYDSAGSPLQGQTVVDPVVGTQSDVDVCQLGDRFAFVYANDDAADQDADFKIFNNSGAQIVGETAIDGTMTPEASNQNLISCSAFNSTSWAYFWYDAAASDDVTLAAVSDSGVTLVGGTDIDGAVGNNAQVATAGLRNRKVALVFYDSVDQDVTISIRQLNGAAFTSILGVTDIDSGAGADSRVAVQEIDMVSQSYFVVAWYNSLDTTIKASVYNETGAQVVAPFNVTVTPNSSYKILDLAGYSSNIGLGLCNGTWAIAYSNASGSAIWETYWYNGSRWDGVCPDVAPPNINLTYPENDSIIELLTYKINYTVNDNRDTIIKNCSLYSNFSGLFTINQTHYDVSVGNNSFNITGIHDASYVWNVLCADNSSNTAFATANYSYKQNYYLPNISGTSINTTILNQSEPVKFNVSISDAWNISNSYITIVYPDSTQFNISLNGNGNEKYFNFNDTTQVGEYSIIYVWANDSLGQSNYINIDLRFNVTTSDPEIFNLLTPYNGTVSSILVPNLTWQQTAESNFANYTILVDANPLFTAPDFVYYRYLLTDTYYVVDYALDANTAYYWRVIAYDIFGNSRNSTDIFVYVTDTLAPSIQLNHPDNNTYLHGNALFNYTPTDTNNISYCILYGNWTGSFAANKTNYTIYNSLPNYFELSLGDGVYKWNVNCTDIANNSVFSMVNKSFIVDNTGPNVSLISPQNNTFENTTNNIIFYGNATDILSNISNCSLYVDNVSARFKSPIIEGEVFNMTYFLDNGQHNWSMSCFDTNGNEDYSVIYNITVNVTDNDPPFIIRNYPDDNLYISNNFVLFNFSVDDSTGIENCSLVINGALNSTNNSILNHEPNYFNITGLVEGTYNWSVECYDNTTQNNYVQTTTRFFYIDLTSPSVSLITPSSNDYLNYSEIIFEYLPIDNRLLSCGLYANFSGIFEEQQSNSSPMNGTSNYFNQILNDGTYIWNVLCEDESLRSSFATQNYTFTVDTISPYYYDLSSYPLSPAIFSLQQYLFNATWGDNINLSSVIIENNFSGILFNYSVDDYIPFGPDKMYYYTVKNLSAGSYYYRWYANDSAGNINSTPVMYYVVDQSNSSIHALFDEVNANKSINEDNYVNLSLQLITPDSGYVELFLNGVSINNGTYGINQLYNYTLFSDPGFYNLTAIYYSTQNYSNSSNSVFLTVNDTTAPDISLSSPANNSPVSAGEINLQYIVNDKSNITNCSLYINGSFIDNSSNVQTNNTQGFTVSLGTGNYSWYVGCYDLSNNYNTSETKFFSAFNVSIVKVSVTLTNASYQYGEFAVININTTGFFNDSLNANFTADIISGNTTVPWWNSSYGNRKIIPLNNPYNVAMTRTLEVNITGFNGSIDNCTKIRIAYFDGTNNIDISHELIAGDNNNSCNVWFTVTLPALSSSSSYYVYYDNSSIPYSGTVELSGIKIQRETVAGTGVSLTANIENANRSKSFVLFTVNAASSAPTIIQFTPTMSIDTQIGFDRYGSGTNANISWQLIEGSDINVQRGSGTLLATATQVNFSISPVNLSNAFIIVDGRVNTATAGNNIQGYFRGTFINNTYISLERTTPGTAATASYQVVEWKNTNVQSGNVSFATVSTTQSINAVNLSRSFIVISRAENGNTGPDASLVTANFINSTAINIARVGALGTASVQWFVVEMPESYNVQNGSTSVGASDVNQLITPVLLRKSFHVEKWSNTNGGTTYSNTLMTSRLTNTSNIFFDKQSATNVNAVNWFVIEEKQPSYTTSTAEILIDQMVNNTAPLGVYSWIWPTYNESLSLYSIVVFAEKSGYQSGVGYNDFNITSDVTLPIITLSYPEDLFISGQGYFNFSYIPYDLNLKNCTLYYGIDSFLPNITNPSPVNNATNNFSNVYISVGLYSWNVLCQDTFNNSAFAEYNYTLNITGPDLFINATNIWFSNSSLIEGLNITIYANITNQGLSPAINNFIVQFFRNDPDIGGAQIGLNISVTSLDVLSSIIVNKSYILSSGNNNIFVKVDSNNSINETSESNNKANNSLSISLYQYYYGNITANILLGSSSNLTIISFNNASVYNGNIFVADYDSSFSFADLQSLGRNKNGDPINNDFSDLDSALNTTGYTDSINVMWAGNADTPIETQSISLFAKILYNVPIINSTNNSNFVTGILWDTNDDALNNFQYDITDKEDVVFITPISTIKQGAYGEYYYETRVPAVLRDYKGSTASVAFYYEMA